MVDLKALTILIIYVVAVTLTQADQIIDETNNMLDEQARSELDSYNDQVISIDFLIQALERLKMAGVKEREERYLKYLPKLLGKSKTMQSLNANKRGHIWK